MSIMKTYFLSFALTLMILNRFTHTSSKSILNFTTDFHALLAFKNTIISDPSGILATTWITNTSICHWPRVSCGAKHQRVTALNVSGLALWGNLAPQLGNLTFLQSLDISSNNFSGSLPSELSKLRRLEYLNVGFNSFTGGIPSWFGSALSELRYVHLHNNTFSGEIPSSLFNISSLVEINMRFNSLSGELPNDICNNTQKLEALFLSGNQLYGQIPENIYNCRNLQDLRLTNNHFNGNIPSEIGSLSLLRVLSLSWNSFEGGIPAEIGYLSQLEVLFIKSASLTGNIPASIFNISSLKTMDLSSNSLSGNILTGSFCNLPQIEELILLYNYFTGSIPKQFGNLTSMKTLDLAYNGLTGELPVELGNLAQLEIFAAPFNHLSGSIPSSIFNISTLIALALQQNNFSGSLPPNMGLSLFNLEELYLFFNNLRGEIPTSITNASELTILELNRNSFTGSVPYFGNLIYLQVLRLWENNLTGAESPSQELGFISSLTNCRDLMVLEISNNPLNGILPPSIGNLSTSLQTIAASNCDIKGVIPSAIVNLSSLVGLYLHENHLTGYIPMNIGKLKHLQRIYLGTNQLKGYIPNGFCQMSKLLEFNLSDNALTGSIPGCLGELRSLRELYLDSNKLNSTIPSELWNLTYLLALNLSSNSLTGELSSQVGSLKAMNQLDLSCNHLSGEIPSSIDGCILLEILYLSNNSFGGSIPQSLDKVRSLNTLCLDNNNLSGSIPKTFENLTLENFDVSYNKLEGEIPDGGCFVNFTSESFAHNSALCGATRFGVPPCMKKHGKSKSIPVLLKYIFPPVISAIIVVVSVVVCIRRRKMVKIPPANDNSPGSSWRRVSYIELVRGTNSFNETSLLGRGSFGSVFKGILSDGLEVAVKVFNLQSEGATKSFETESQILSAVRHRNLLRIIGCCTNIEFKALILEYMPNGSLEKWLHSENYRLDLPQRVEIAIDVALALEYLHHGYTFPVVHCDIKPSNVLLDEEMTAHVGDFGIAKLFDEGETVVLTNTLATIGYAAPEYGSEGKVSRNGDVYSYGILLLEMFTRKRPTDDMFSGEVGLKEWVSEALQENATSEVADPELVAREDRHFTENERCVSSIFDLAMKCLAVSPNERIKMVEVAAALKKIRGTFFAGIRRR